MLKKLCVLYAALSYIMLLTCGNGTESQTTGSIDENKMNRRLGLPSIPELVSLELEIGEQSNLDSAFIVVMPMDLIVNDQDDIIILDESTIKVYDSTGTGKKLIGGPGEGPGEFSKSPTLHISPKGFITASEPPSTGNAYSVYDPDYNFIDEFRFGCSPLLENFLVTKNMSADNYQYISAILALDSSSILYEMVLKSNSDFYRLIAYEDSSAIIPVYFAIHNSYFVYGKHFRVSSFFGNIFCYILSGRKFFYLNTEEDKIINENTGEYTFHIVSLDTREDKIYSNKFKPMLMPEEIIEQALPRTPPSRKVSKESEEFREKLRQWLIEKKYLQSIRYFLIDNNYLFLFLTNVDNNDNIIIHLFDINDEKFVNEFSWPLGTKPPSTIKNGYVYINTIDSEGFSVIRKYKLDPAVYGK